MSPSSSKISALEFLAPMIVGCALFMEMLDATVISTALPAMAKSLGEDPIKLNLAITSYLLSLAVFIPISGWMADRLRRAHRLSHRDRDLHDRFRVLRTVAIRCPSWSPRVFCKASAAP